MARPAASAEVQPRRRLGCALRDRLKRAKESTCHLWHWSGGGVRVAGCVVNALLHTHTHTHTHNHNARVQPLLPTHLRLGVMAGGMALHASYSRHVALSTTRMCLRKRASEFVCEFANANERVVNVL